MAAAIAGAVADLIRGATGGLASGRIMATVAQAFIIGLAVIAALNQMGIAVTVTLPVLITVLATIGGIAVVGIGGGLIGPMRQRWERWLDSAEAEGDRVRERRAATNGHTGSPVASQAPTSGAPTPRPVTDTGGQPEAAQTPRPPAEGGLAP